MFKFKDGPTFNLSISVATQLTIGPGATRITTVCYDFEGECCHWISSSHWEGICESGRKNRDEIDTMEKTIFPNSSISMVMHLRDQPRFDGTCMSMSNVK